MMLKKNHKTSYKLLIVLIKTCRIISAVVHIRLSLFVFIDHILKVVAAQMLFSWPHRFEDENEEQPHPPSPTLHPPPPLHALNIHYSSLSSRLIIEYWGTICQTAKRYSVNRLINFTRIATEGPSFNSSQLGVAVIISQLISFRRIDQPNDQQQLL